MKESGRETPPAALCGPSGSAAISACSRASACGARQEPHAYVPDTPAMYGGDLTCQPALSKGGCQSGCASHSTCMLELETAEPHLQHGRGDGAHDGVAADGGLRDGRQAGRDVHLQPLGQHHEARQVHRQQLREECLREPCGASAAASVALSGTFCTIIREGRRSDSWTPFSPLAASGPCEPLCHA